ncbi:hypothetical protein VaNZ11_004159 [Volvox africanus]|uniref:SBP-type domain-containing protein n=1 Tax=Volvox africanus TaxID=51714 RepID=A0ABQ5RWT8_9CHLO|nr:hypothetical protein VaNZ11_004159 [Volvox africanus]
MDAENVVAAAHVYRDASRGIYSGLQAFLNDPRLSDIILVRPDGLQIHVHQVILAASSRRFAVLLANGDATGKELPIQGVDSVALESVVSFFYSGECLLTPATVIPIYDVCLKLGVPGLAAGCEQYLRQNLTPQTCSTFLEASVQLLLEQTIKQCLDYAKSRFNDVIATSTFQSLSSEAVRLLLTFCRASAGEIGLARALARWAVRRPEHLAECEAMFKELNITTTVLLQLLQSPDFVAGLQAANPAAEAGTGTRRAVAGTAGAAAAGTTPVEAGASYSGPAAARVSGGVARLEAGLGNLEASAAGLPDREATQKSSRFVATDGGATQHVVNQQVPGGTRGRQLQHIIQTGLGSAVSAAGPLSPGNSSAGGKAEVLGYGGGGLGSGRDRASSGGRPQPLSFSQGERCVPGPQEVANAKRSLAAVDSAAGAAGGAGGGSRVALLQQQVFHGRLGRQRVMEEAPPAGDGGASSNAHVDFEAAYLPQPLQEMGGSMASTAKGGGGVCGTSTREEAAEPPRMRKLEAAAAVATVATIREAVRNAAIDVVVENPQSQLQPPFLGLGLDVAAALADDGDAASPRTADSGGNAGGEALFGVRLPALEQAGLTLHLLPSGAVAASGGVLGTAQLPLQVVPAGAGPHPTLLALLPRTVMVQLQQPPGRISEETCREAGTEQARQQSELSRVTALPPLVALPPLLPKQQPSMGSLLEPRGGDRGCLGPGLGPSGGARLPLLLNAVADEYRANGGGSADSVLEGELGTDILDLRVLGVAGGGSGTGHSGRLLLPSRLVPSGKEGAGAAALSTGTYASSASEGLRTTTAAAAQQQPDSDAVGGLEILSAAAAAGGALTPMAPLARGSRTGASSLHSGSGGVLAAGDVGRGLPALAPQYEPSELSGLVQQYRSSHAVTDSGGTAAAVAVAASVAAQLVAGRVAGGRPASMSLAWDEDPAVAAAGTGGGKKRRPSPAEGDLDHIEDGAGGCSGSRAGGGGGGGRGGGRHFHGGRAWHDGGQGGGGAAGNKAPLLCHVPSCNVDLSSLKEYHQRFRICDLHLKAEHVVRDGVLQRFCQQCGRFHTLSEFDGTKRSCRARLLRHNARRRKRPEHRGSGGERCGNDEPRKAQRSPSYAAAASGHTREAAAPSLLNTPTQLAAFRDVAFAAGLAAAAHGTSFLLSDPDCLGLQQWPYELAGLPRDAAAIVELGASERAPNQDRAGQPSKIFSEEVLVPGTAAAAPTKAAAASGASLMQPMLGGGMEPLQLCAAGTLDCRMKEPEMHSGQDPLRGARQSARAAEGVHPSPGDGTGRDQPMTGSALHSGAALTCPDAVPAADNAERRKNMLNGLDGASSLDEHGCPADGCQAAGRLPPAGAARSTSNGCCFNGNDSQIRTRSRAKNDDEHQRNRQAGT